MCPRIDKSVRRPTPVTIRVNGNTVNAYEGESIATALMASGTLVMSRDSFGRPRSPYCNMGVCFDCLVTIEESAVPGSATPGDAAPGGAASRRVRACLALVRPGLHVTVPGR